MYQTFQYTISGCDTGLTIYEFLKSKGYSRHLLTMLKHTGCGILKNGNPAYPSELLNTGDFLSIRWEEVTAESGILPVQMELVIIYEDRDLMIIEKPADMPIHPSMNNYENTLANGVAWYFAHKGEPFTYRCINRLDRDTTGLLIVAKHKLSASILSNMVKNRLIHREYLAIATGAVPSSGTINAPIARKPGSVMERTVDFENGESAVTHYRCLAVKDQYSLVSLTLETGRTHQIRVHMKYLGHPLIGDYLYNPDYTHMKRQSLHSCRLRFLHPLTGEQMEFVSPLPEDMCFLKRKGSLPGFWEPRPHGDIC